MNECNCKPNKSWIDQEREFYNSFIKNWLDDDNILMYLTHNAGKSVVAETFIENLKGKYIQKNWKLMMINFVLVI